MTLVERFLAPDDIVPVILREPTRVVLAAEADGAILAQIQGVYDTKAEADRVRKDMDRRRPDNFYALGATPVDAGPSLVGGKLRVSFVPGKTTIWAGPLKANAGGEFRKIREGMK